MKNNEESTLKILISMYENAINLSNHEGNLVWSRFNAFMVTHTILGALIGQILIATSIYNKSLYISIISLIGMVLCEFWILSTMRGFSSIDFWNYATRVIEEKIPDKYKPITLFRKGYDYFHKNLEVEFDFGETKKLNPRLKAPFPFLKNKTITYSAIYFIFLIYSILFVYNLLLSK